MPTEPTGPGGCAGEAEAGSHLPAEPQGQAGPFRFFLAVVGPGERGWPHYRLWELWPAPLGWPGLVSGAARELQEEQAVSGAFLRKSSSPLLCLWAQEVGTSGPQREGQKA